MDEVFVRNLPLDLFGPELEELFGEVGPVKKGSVIHNKKTHGGEGEQTSRGFGFVKFALASDAEDCVKTMNGKLVRGRVISVELAAKKGAADTAKREMKAPLDRLSEGAPSKTRKVAAAHTAEVDVEVKEPKEPKEPNSSDTVVDKEVPKAKSKKATAKPSKEEIAANAQPANLRTLRVFGLSEQTTEKHLLKRLQKLGTIESVEKLKDSAGPRVFPKGGMAKVQVATIKEAAKVAAALDQKTLHGKTLSLRYEVHVAKAERTVLLPGAKKATRVMVRNLNFKASEDDLGFAAAALGPLADVHIPTVTMAKHFDPSGTKEQSRGFGFVQFMLKDDANKAVKAGTLQVCGRDTVLTLASAKKDFDASTDRPPMPGAGETDEAKDGDKSEADTDDDEDEEGSKNDEDDDDDGDDDDEDDDNDDDEKDEKREKDKLAKAAPEKAKDDKPRVSKDISEGRTLFVRSLPLEASEADLARRFEDFGAVAKATIVKDQGTGLAKGTGFVTFEDASSVDAALKRCAGAALLLLGRPLEAMKAVDRNTASTELGKKGRESAKALRDRRNLYLKDEGLLLGVADAARKAAGRERHKSRHSDHEEGPACPAGDLEKRRHAFADKKKKLTNPLFFISPLRLSVRNLARSVDDSELKRIFSRAAQEGLIRGLVGSADVKAQADAAGMGEGANKADYELPDPTAPAKLTSCKIMRNVDREGQPSRGYGFVEFTSHAHALAALRWTNNNPALSAEAAQGGSKVASRSRDPLEWPRLIVEFAVENRSKLQMQEKRKETAEKRKEQRKLIMGGEESKGQDSTKKLSRGQKQREKRRLERSAGDESGGASNAQDEKTAKASKRPRAQVLAPSEAMGGNAGGRAMGGRAREAEEEEMLSGEVGSRKPKVKRRKADPEDDLAKIIKDYKSKLFGGPPGSDSGGAAKQSSKFQETSARWFE